jgi:integrase
VSVLKVKLPPNPFAGVKLKDPGPQRYHSDINPEWLLVCAENELRTKRPQQYLALFLCLCAGLRRKEADLLTWQQIDFDAGQIHIRRTACFEPKTEESQRDIDIAPAALDILRTFKAGVKTEFVLVGSDPHPAATYDFYRCDGTWRDLNAWLRGKGIHHRKAIHSLRKESGSLVASDFGIEAARQHLGHRDIRTTSAHYVDKKKRVEVSLSYGNTTGQLKAVT